MLFVGKYKKSAATVENSPVVQGNAYLLSQLELEVAGFKAKRDEIAVKISELPADCVSSLEISNASAQGKDTLARSLSKQIIENRKLKKYHLDLCDAIAGREWVIAQIRKSIPDTTPTAAIAAVVLSKKPILTTEDRKKFNLEWIITGPSVRERFGNDKSKFIIHRVQEEGWKKEYQASPPALQKKIPHIQQYIQFRSSFITAEEALIFIMNRL